MTKHVFLFVIVAFSGIQARCQERLNLTLTEAIELANGKSYDALIAKNRFMSAYWGFNTYKAQSLPSLRLNTTLFRFNRDITRQFNPTDTSFSFFQQQNINSDGQLVLNQNLIKTGGSLYIDSDLGWVNNFGDQRNSQQYSATPIRVGLRQPLFAFNQFKWDKRLEPLKFEQKSKEYVQSAERIALRTIDQYFGFLKARLSYQIAEKNYLNSDSLYQIAKRRFEIMSISKSELLSLRLQVVNSQNRMNQSRNNMERTRISLYSFLSVDLQKRLIIKAPESIPNLEVDGRLALEKAKENNPEFLGFRLDELQSNRTVEQAKAASRFNANLSASYGFNQRGESVDEAYQNLLGQQRVNLTLNIPILDWGVRKSQYHMSLREQKAQMMLLQQQKAEFEQELIISISEFNIQKDVVASSREAMDLASEVYETKLRRYLIGESSVNDLIQQADRKDNALMSYYDALEKYWRSFYQIRLVTLYDFVENRNLVKEKPNVSELD